MSIGTYSELKTAIGAWHFDEGTLLAAYYDDFIDMAEARFNYGAEGQFGTPALRTWQMETFSDLTLTSGAAALPTDYLEWRRVVAQTSPIRTLQFLPPGSMDVRYDTTYAAPPSYFSIEGGSLAARPTTSSDIRFYYYQKIPALSDANTTNWLLTAMPNLYLYACVLEAAIYRSNTKRAGDMLPLVVGFVAGLNASDKGARWAHGVARPAMVCP